MLFVLQEFPRYLDIPALYKDAFGGARLLLGFLISCCECGDNLEEILVKSYDLSCESLFR